MHASDLRHWATPTESGPPLGRDSPRLSYWHAEANLYREVFMIAVRDAGAPAPKSNGPASFEKKAYIGDAVAFLFDPDDRRRYKIGGMAGLRVDFVDRLIAKLRDPSTVIAPCARGGPALTPASVARLRERADERFPIPVKATA